MDRRVDGQIDGPGENECCTYVAGSGVRRPDFRARQSHPGVWTLEPPFPPLENEAAENASIRGLLAVLVQIPLDESLPDP